MTGIKRLACRSETVTPAEAEGVGQLLGELVIGQLLQQFLHLWRVLLCCLLECL